MKKLIICILSLVICFMCFAGCENSSVSQSSTDGNEQPGDNKPDYTLVLNSAENIYDDQERVVFALNEGEGVTVGDMDNSTIFKYECVYGGFKNIVQNGVQTQVFKYDEDEQCLESIDDADLFWYEKGLDYFIAVRADGESGSVKIIPADVVTESSDIGYEESVGLIFKASEAGYYRIEVPDCVTVKANRDFGRLKLGDSGLGNIGIRYFKQNEGVSLYLHSENGKVQMSVKISKLTEMPNEILPTESVQAYSVFNSSSTTKEYCIKTAGRASVSICTDARVTPSVSSTVKPNEGIEYRFILNHGQSAGLLLEDIDNRIWLTETKSDIYWVLNGSVITTNTALLVKSGKKVSIEIYKNVNGVVEKGEILDGALAFENGMIDTSMLIVGNSYSYFGQVGDDPTQGLVIYVIPAIDDVNLALNDVDGYSYVTASLTDCSCDYTITVTDGKYDYVFTSEDVKPKRISLGSEVVIKQIVFENISVKGGMIELNGPWDEPCYMQ